MHGKVINYMSSQLLHLTCYSDSTTSNQLVIFGFWKHYISQDGTFDDHECLLISKSVVQYVYTTKSQLGKPLGLLQLVAKPRRLWDEIVNGFHSWPPGKQWQHLIWTVIDIFSKHEYFIPCRGLRSAWRLAKMFIRNIYHLHRVPRWICWGDRSNPVPLWGN